MRNEYHSSEEESTATLFPKTIEGFGYKFNDAGELRHIETGERFNFNERENNHSYNQARYEALGELVTEYVYTLLTDSVGLQKFTIPIDVKVYEPSTFIFHSKDAFENDKLILLIHGSGVVRAGQWSRRLIINDSINSGTQLPFIKRAIELGYGVIVLNTNDNYRHIDGETKKIKGSHDPEQHAFYVWQNVISRTAARHIGIIAHSYGGLVTVHLCQKYESFRKSVFAIAFTDSCHNLTLQRLSHSSIKWIVKISQNWISSSKPLDTVIQFKEKRNSKEVPSCSAGTTEHEYTSWSSFTSFFKFLDVRLRQRLSENTS